MAGRARLADSTKACCSPAKPPVSAVRASSFSPMMWTFWRCFCGERLRRASSLALSSQSGRPGRRCPPGAPGRNPGRRGAVGAVGRATGGVAVLVPSPGFAAPSGRRGAGAVGRPTGFCSCISSPGATGLRMPAGMPGRCGPPAPVRIGGAGRPPLPVELPSRRIGLPTSSSVLPPLRAGAPGRMGRPGLPGRCGAPVPGRWGAPGPLRVGGAPLPGRRGTGLPTSSGRGVGRAGAPALTGAPGRAGAPGRCGAPARPTIWGLGGCPGVGRLGAPAGRGVGFAAVGLEAVGREAVGRAGGATGLLTTSGFAA